MTETATRRLAEVELNLSPRWRRVWNWLRRQTFPDEPLLHRLRNAEAIEIHHPQSLSTEEATSLWCQYLLQRRRRHAVWLVVDLVLSLVSVVLSPLPGPNFLGYWLFYRLICHIRAQVGLSSALRRVPTTNFLASSILDEPDASFARVAQVLGFRELDDFLARTTVRASDANP